MKCLYFIVKLISFLTWPEDCVTSSAAGAAKFKITDTKLYVILITLSHQDNAKLLQRLKSGFIRTIKWNKYQPNVSKETPYQYLHFLLYPIFQVVNRLFVLSYENEDDRTVSTGYYLPKLEIKDYKIMIDGRNVFDQPVKNNLITCHYIKKTVTGQEDDYTTGYLLMFFINEETKETISDFSQGTVKVP